MAETKTEPIPITDYQEIRPFSSSVPGHVLDNLIKSPVQYAYQGGILDFGLHPLRSEKPYILPLKELEFNTSGGLRINDRPPLYLVRPFWVGYDRPDLWEGKGNSLLIARFDLAIAPIFAKGFFDLMRHDEIEIDFSYWQDSLDAPDHKDDGSLAGFCLTTTRELAPNLVFSFYKSPITR